MLIYFDRRTVKTNIKCKTQLKVIQKLTGSTKNVKSYLVQSTFQHKNKQDASQWPSKEILNMNLFVVNHSPFAIKKSAKIKIPAMVPFRFDGSSSTKETKPRKAYPYKLF